MHSGAQCCADKLPSTSVLDLLASISTLVSVAQKGMSKAIAPYGLTTAEFNCLWFCLDKEEETTATKLASHLPVDASRISRIVTVLVDKGLLVRRRLRSDRRIVMLRLTKEGKELALQIRQSVDLYYAKLTRGIDEIELQNFASVASTIVANHLVQDQRE